MPTTKAAQKKLHKDFQALIDDSHALIESLGGDLDKKTKEAVGKLEESLEALKDRALGAEQYAVEEVQKLEDVVKEHPLPSLGITLGVGFLLGLLMRKG